MSAAIIAGVDAKGTLFYYNLVSHPAEIEVKDMPRRVPGQPFPHDVWLRVSFENVPPDKRDSVRDRLLRLSGWDSSLTGDDGGGFRYNYVAGRQNSTVRRARQILASVGDTDPQVTSFVVWWLELNFARRLDTRVFATMTRSMEAAPEVLATHSIGRLEGVRIEFRGEPPAAVVEHVRSLAAPHMA